MAGIFAVMYPWRTRTPAYKATTFHFLMIVQLPTLCETLLCSHSSEQNSSQNQRCIAYEFTSTPDDLLSSCDLVLSVCGSADCCSFCNLMLNFSLYATSSLPFSSTCFSNVVSNMDIWKIRFTDSLIYRPKCLLIASASNNGSRNLWKLWI